MTEGNSLLHAGVTDIFGDAGYQGVDKRPDAKEGVAWHVAMRPGKRKELDPENKPIDALIDKMEKAKASIRPKSSTIQGHQAAIWLVKARYRGFNKNTLRIKTLFALSNLWIGAPYVDGKGMSAPENRARAMKKGSNEPEEGNVTGILRKAAEKHAIKTSGVYIAVVRASCSDHPSGSRNIKKIAIFSFIFKRRKLLID